MGREGGESARVHLPVWSVMKEDPWNVISDFTGVMRGREGKSSNRDEEEKSRVRERERWSKDVERRRCMKIQYQRRQSLLQFYWKL
jgi:hypothetical protein